jgi:MerR family transcriptional regulator, thiopeptide resistance regulator
MTTFSQSIPLLVYRDILAAHDFLVNVLGFESGGVHYDAEGRAVHGEVRVGTTTLWLHRVTEEHELGSPVSGVRGSGMVVFVDDVDTHFERVRAAGIRTDDEPRDQPYGQREYGVRDPEGHRWWFATPIATSAEV